MVPTTESSTLDEVRPGKGFLVLSSAGVLLLAVLVAGLWRLFRRR